MVESLTQWNDPEAMRRRYETIIAQEVDGLGLDSKEWMFLCDILNGTLLDMVGWYLLEMEATDADDSYEGKWGVERAKLAAKLRKMTFAQRAAASEVVVRWWEAADTSGVKNHDELLELALQQTREQGVRKGRD